jgi:hypothetical protein
MRQGAVLLVVVAALGAGCGDEASSPTDGATDTPTDDAAVPEDSGVDGDARDVPDAAPTDGETSGGRSCTDPGPGWLLCEDFERGAGDWEAWAAGTPFLDSPGFDDRGRVRLASD